MGRLNGKQIIQERKELFSGLFLKIMYNHNGFVVGERSWVSDILTTWSGSRPHFHDSHSHCFIFGLSVPLLLYKIGCKSIKSIRLEIAGLRPITGVGGVGGWNSFTVICLDFLTVYLFYFHLIAGRCWL